MECLYLAGPLTPVKSGLATEYLSYCRNFFLAEVFLLEQGYNAFNPARDILTILFLPKQLDMKVIYRISRDWVSRCDAVALLPDWFISKGVREELKIAKKLKKRVFLIAFDSEGMPVMMKPLKWSEIDKMLSSEKKRNKNQG